MNRRVGLFMIMLREELRQTALHFNNVSSPSVREKAITEYLTIVMGEIVKSLHELQLSEEETNNVKLRVTRLKFEVLPKLTEEVTITNEVQQLLRRISHGMGNKDFT